MYTFHYTCNCFLPVYKGQFKTGSLIDNLLLHDIKSIEMPFFKEVIGTRRYSIFLIYPPNFKSS